MPSSGAVISEKYSTAGSDKQDTDAQPPEIQ